MGGLFTISEEVPETQKNPDLRLFASVTGIAGICRGDAASLPWRRSGRFALMARRDFGNRQGRGHQAKGLRLIAPAGLLALLAMAGPAHAAGGAMPPLVHDIGVGLFLSGFLAVIFTRLR